MTIRFLTLTYMVLPALAFVECGASLVISETGSTGTRDHTLFVESPGVFRIGFDWGYNYGMTQWHDLVNDPDPQTLEFSASGN
ncbi:MAG: hypothetical protein PHF70_13120 [Opitutales bacterium]|nr:hypothetical protein [Opitutales bacterium]